MRMQDTLDVMDDIEPDQAELFDVDEIEEPADTMDQARERFIQRKLVDALYLNKCNWVLGKEKSKRNALKFFDSICLESHKIHTSEKGTALKKPRLPNIEGGMTPEQVGKVIIDYMTGLEDPELKSWTTLVSNYADLARVPEDYDTFG